MKFAACLDSVTQINVMLLALCCLCCVASVPASVKNFKIFNVMLGVQMWPASITRPLGPTSHHSVKR